MKIIGYGCSHTAGGESVDHLLAGMTLEECVETKKEFYSKDNGKFFEWYDKYTNPNNMDPEKVKYWFEEVPEGTPDVFITRIVHEELKNTWVRFLAEKMGVDYNNRAKSGSCISRNVWNLLQDIETGVVEKDDLIVFALPSMIRWCYWPEKFDIDIPVGEPETFIVSFWLNPNNNFTKNISKSTQLEVAEKMLTDTNLMWEYVKGLEILKGIAKTRGNLYCFVTDPLDVMRNSTTKHKILKKIFLDNLKEKHILPVSGLYDHDTYSGNWEATYGFGHPRIEHQKEFANKLYEAINNAS